MPACNSIRLENHVQPVGLVDTGATKATYVVVSVIYNYALQNIDWYYITVTKLELC